jgi:hypothetical protein
MDYAIRFPPLGGGVWSCCWREGGIGSGRLGEGGGRRQLTEVSSTPGSQFLSPTTPEIPLPSPSATVQLVNQPPFHSGEKKRRRTGLDDSSVSCSATPSLSRMMPSWLSGFSSKKARMNCCAMPDRTATRLGRMSVMAAARERSSTSCGRGARESNWRGVWQMARQQGACQSWRLHARGPASAAAEIRA